MDATCEEFFQKIHEEAKLQGFESSELESWYLDDLCNPDELSKIEIPQLIRILVLAYYRG
ncbi:MAG TPA: hypothetical protein DEP60_03855 [Ruminococcaceae bacterium]|jgi:hypothetical protein|nr:hypothetical protein [Oscillospiraceae bacterium]HCC01813.1 hypothetical protein [Oscillospiraceae bacterium]